MSFMKLLPALAIVVPILAVLILVVVLVIRKQNKTKDELEAAMTQEQKARLLSQKALPGPEGKGGFVIEALVVKLEDKGEKYLARLMWNNTVIPNNFLNQLMMANVKVSKADAEAHQLRVGSYVQFWMDPEKQKWEILF